MIAEFVDIIRSMLTYRMDRRPTFKDLFVRMLHLFAEEEVQQKDAVHMNLLCAMKFLQIAITVPFKKAGELS